MRCASSASQAAERDGEGSKWSLKAFRAHIERQGVVPWSRVWDQILHTVTVTGIAVEPGARRASWLQCTRDATAPWLYMPGVSGTALHLAHRTRCCQASHRPLPNTPARFNGRC